MAVRAKVLFFALVAGAVGIGALSGQAQKQRPIPFPTGYRSWNLVKTMVIFSNEHSLFSTFGGLHNIYVNDTGLSPLKQGKAYPDGTVFVMDLYDIRSTQGAMETRDRKFIALMKKNSRLYRDTGGWGFEIFRGYEETGSLQDMKRCFDCHTSRKLSDYVYSTYTP